MTMDLLKGVSNCLGPLVIASGEFRGDVTVEVPKARITEVLARLRDDPDLAYDFLVDLLGVDNIELYKKAAKPKKKTGGEGDAAEEPKPEGPPPPRFEVNYLLLSLSTNRRLQVKVRVPEDDLSVPSVTGLWKAATWPERETYDMFGIRFPGHPDLRRLLMWDEFPAHPLRKDYPLEGRGEVRILRYE